MLQRGADRRPDHGTVRGRGLGEPRSDHVRGTEEPAGETRRLAGELVYKVMSLARP